MEQQTLDEAEVSGMSGITYRKTLPPSYMPIQIYLNHESTADFSAVNGSEPEYQPGGIHYQRLAKNFRWARKKGRTRYALISLAIIATTVGILFV
jgi:hypothetical protein